MGENNRYLSVYINGKLFAIYLDSIAQIIGLQKITIIPNSEPYLKGIINLRGKIVPIIDMKQLMFGEDVVKNRRTNIIVVDYEEESIGFIVDALEKVHTYQEEQISVMTETSKRASLDRFIGGVISIENETRPILDLDKIYTGLENNLSEE